MPENEIKELSTGLYNANELTKFDQHQAWTTEFELPFPKSHIVVSVGDVERVRLPTRLQLGVDMSQEGAHMRVVQNILQNGEYGVNLPSFDIAIRSAEQGIENLPSKNVHLESIVDELRAEVEAERSWQIEAKVARVAGFIAEHPNLWIVTKNTITDRDDRNMRKVGVALLRGLAVVQDANLVDVPPLAVVEGRNGRKALLSGRRSPNLGGRPEVKTVVRGYGPIR